MRLLLADGIFGLCRYASLFALRAQGRTDWAAETQRVYSFKKRGHNAAFFKSAVEAAANALGCTAVVAVPGHTPATNRLQTLLGETLRRTRDVPQRKYNHKADIAYAIEAATVAGEIPGGDGKVLIVDDVCTTGRSLRFWRRYVGEKTGRGCVLLALGINAKMNPAETDIEIDPADDADATDPVADDGEWSDEWPEAEEDGSADGTDGAQADPSPQHGGAANLRPALTTDEARELGRRGGIASGIARRKRKTMRDELLAILFADDGVVAKNIAVAICREAKHGNVGAFRAITQVLGELKEVIETPDALPPPIVIPIHDAAFIEAERERQKREFAELTEAAAIEMCAGNLPGNGETWDARAQPLDDGSGDGATVAPTGSGNAPETGAEAAGDDPPDADGKAHAADADAPQGELDPFVPPPRRPRTPSEAAAIRREREKAERGKCARETGGGFRAVPLTFPKR